MKAIKENWWHIAEEPEPEPIEVAWRPIDPYCITEIQYFDLTVHRAGTAQKNNYLVRGGTDTMLQRRKADGAIRETEIPNNTQIQPSFLTGDIVASTVPLNDLTELHLRFHIMENLLFIPSVHTPNLQVVLFRGNWARLGDLDMENCRNISIFDVSQCYINSLKFPLTGPNDMDNYFQWGYLGHYDPGHRDQMPPVQVMDEVTKRAYWSKVSPTADNTGTFKKLSTNPGNGNLVIDGIHMHHKLVNEKKWLVMHLSLETFEFSADKSGEDRPFDLMTSYHDWELNIGVDWITSDKYAGEKKNEEQRIMLNIAPNTTGAVRTTVLHFRKIKRYPFSTNKSWEDGTEFHHKAYVTVTQNG